MTDEEKKATGEAAAELDARIASILDAKLNSALTSCNNPHVIGVGEHPETLRQNPDAHLPAGSSRGRLGEPNKRTVSVTLPPTNEPPP